MKKQIKGLPTDIVRKLQRGELDSNGQKPEVQISNGNGNPCRHCLKMIKEGEEFLVLSHRPFTTVQPYAELGPLFLHVHECKPFDQETDVPEALLDSENYLLRGYDHNERIVYGTGKVVTANTLDTYSENLLSLEAVEFVHVRSASNNCYQARIDKC